MNKADCEHAPRSHDPQHGRFIIHLLWFYKKPLTSSFLPSVPLNQQMTKAFLPQMKAKNHGHIVTIASALGLFSTACVEVRHMINDLLSHTLNRQILQQAAGMGHLNSNHSAGIYFPPPGLLCQ